MNNQFFYFIIILLFKYSCQFEEFDYFAYYIPGKNIIICSDKQYVRSNLILNEFENDNGFTCLINLKKNGIYRINFQLAKLNDDKGLYSEMINKNLDQSKNMLDINLGKNSLFKDLDLAFFQRKPSLSKQFWVKFDHGKVSYLSNNDCESSNIEDCNFLLVKDSVFMKKFIKLNFIFKQQNFQEIVLLEKEMLSKIVYNNTLGKFKSTEECDPACVYGICNEGDCQCKMGYMGINCSISNNIINSIKNYR